jgi:hypothetical protein
MTHAKPAYGSPCNGCGVCCEKELCPLAAALYDRWAGPCPALLPADAKGAKACGLIADPARFFPLKVRRFGAGELSRTAALINGAGLGCDYPLPHEDDPVMARVLRHRASATGRSERARAIHVWGIGPKLATRHMIDGLFPR